MPAFGVITVGIKECIHPTRLSQLTVANRVSHPPEVTLTREPQDQARDRDERTAGDRLAQKRVGFISGKFARDKYAAARPGTSFSCYDRRYRLRPSRNSADSIAVVPGRLPTPTSA